eukprot:CAMPEP_0172657314 /NCGR_PEP_ID=MMETSP1074-20121228/2018_1 /TAXON_ID=2916 /ORGANISM="Ceratium fusus, Strain PA161109" /LENGTH=181 /DNA_ID=CAMNT_0013472377 /DNA_START=96 /DNA_END=639 /DNA_ORIENTATION=+
MTWGGVGGGHQSKGKQHRGRYVQLQEAKASDSHPHRPQPVWLRKPLQDGRLAKPGDSTSAVSPGTAYVTLLIPSFEAELAVFTLWMLSCSKWLSVERSSRFLSMFSSQEVGSPMNSLAISTQAKSPAAKIIASCLREFEGADISFKGAARLDNDVQPLRLSGVGFGIRREMASGYQSQRFD